MLQTSRNRSVHLKRLIKSFGDSKGKQAAIYIEGTKTSQRIPTSDVDAEFRQESNFYWVTGCNEPDCAALVNIDDEQFVMLTPDLDDDHALWCGDFPLPEDYKTVLGANKVISNKPESLVKLVQELNIKKLYTLESKNDTLQNTLKDVTVDKSTLYGTLRDLRMIKLSDEIEEMKKICKVSADAHIQVMRHAKPNINEYQLEAVFRYYTSLQGATRLAYSVISAGDERGATLHYVNNNKVVKDGSLYLIDAGAEFPDSYYASDITRTYPINGKFTQKQKEIYEIVLKANKEVIASMKPGVQWVDMHRLADRIITQGLLDLNILKGDIEELIKNHVGGYFLPHGLGHAIGLDVHDPPNRDGSFKAINEPGIRYLRTHCELKEGVALTVEPGLYFVPRLLRKALADPVLSKFLNKEKLEQYFDFGGIRIEDDVVVTKDGVLVLTSDVPKEIDEMEAIIGKSQ
ncbi:Xaa-Pro dipeptidase [Acrasis kona]|uniref:Xaa-Pro dipeptidase n=1 Tax=Acrasis kona TaxID=1008807 RepID=A0AAW2ZCR4_9EUKA